MPTPRRKNQAPLVRESALRSPPKPLIPRHLFRRAISRFQFTRNLACKITGIFHPKRARDVRSSLFPGVRTRDVLADLKSRGLFLGLNLPTLVTIDVWRFVRSTKCHAG